MKMYYDLICSNHNEVNTCECGANRICHECGFGCGAIPCACNPGPQVKYLDWDCINAVLVDNHELWERLAEV